MSHFVLKHITKNFPGVSALDDVSFSFAAGEVHALCGENGAGTCTLMNILAGNLKPDHGHIELRGVEYIFDKPQQAMAQIYFRRTGEGSCSRRKKW